MKIIVKSYCQDSKGTRKIIRARETVMKKTISIGAQDFAELREQDCFYIDKTELIKEWWNNRDVVTLIGALEKR